MSLVLFQCLALLSPFPLGLVRCRQRLAFLLLSKLGIGVVLPNGLEQKTRAVFDLARGLAALEEVDFFTDIVQEGHLRILNGLCRPLLLIHITKALLPNIPRIV